jgi:hypothetical protein
MNAIDHPEVGVASLNHSPATDIHVVASSMPASLHEALVSLGFTGQAVLGGDPRVQMNHLLSIKHAEVRESDRVFALAQRACADVAGFSGYIKQEVVGEDIVIDSPPVERTPIPCPIRALPQSCPADLYKRCDIHATARVSDEAMHQVLAQSGFYHLILRKPLLGAVRVNTLQFESSREGWRTWRQLVDYLKGCEQFRGSAKLELTRGFVRFGYYTLPPIVKS